jgi:hypothetical protein
MIPKITRGSDVGGLFAYLCDVDPKRTRNVHEEPHLVGGDPLVTAWWGGGQVLSRADGREIAKVLDEPRRVFGVPDVTASGEPFRHVWHCSLSVRAEEGRLGDEKWEQIADQFVSRMGFVGVDGKAPCRVAVVHHGLSAAGNDHVHVVVSLVREDGTKAGVWNDYRRAQGVCRDLETEHGLTVTEGRAFGRGTRGVTRAELEIAARTGRPEPTRFSVARAVRGHATMAVDEADFVRRVRAGGMLAKPRYAAGREDVVAGWKVAARPRKGERAVYFSGTQLGADLTLPRLRATHGWGTSGDPAADVTAAGAAVAEWGRAYRDRPISAPPASPVPDPEIGRGYAEQVGRVREWLRTVPEGDVATWAVTAGQAAGVFAAWSAAVEGERPGPLARAADVLARDAQIRPGAAAGAVRAPVPRWSVVAAQLARGGRGMPAQALLLVQLGNLAKALHDRALAVGAVAQAAELERVARTELAAVRRAVPSLNWPVPEQTTAVPARPGLADPTRTLQRARTSQHQEQGTQR